MIRLIPAMRSSEPSRHYPFSGSLAQLAQKVSRKIHLIPVAFAKEPKLEDPAKVPPPPPGGNDPPRIENVVPAPQVPRRPLPPPRRLNNRNLDQMAAAFLGEVFL